MRGLSFRRRVHNVQRMCWLYLNEIRQRPRRREALLSRLSSGVLKCKVHISTSLWTCSSNVPAAMLYQGISFEYSISTFRQFTRGPASPFCSNSSGKGNHRYLTDHACRCSHGARRETSKIQGDFLRSAQRFLEKAHRRV